MKAGGVERRREKTEMEEEGRELKESTAENCCGAGALTRTGRLTTSHIRSTFHLLMAFFYKGFL